MIYGVFFDLSFTFDFFTYSNFCIRNIYNNSIIYGIVINHLYSINSALR